MCQRYLLQLWFWILFWFFFVFRIFSGSLIKKSLPELGLKNGYIKLMQNVSSSNQKQRLKQSEPCQERDRGERERASEDQKRYSY